MKAGGQHSDHGSRLTLNRDPTAKHMRIAVEMRRPQTMADDGHRRSSRAVLLRQKVASHFGSDAEHVKELFADLRCLHLLRQCSRLKADDSREVAGHRLKGVRVLLQALELDE